MNHTIRVASIFPSADGPIATALSFLGRMPQWWKDGDAAEPWFSLGLFLVCAILMVQRLNALERKGLEGTVLGTLVMPYASGFPNLMFALSLGRQGGNGGILVENCIVNNVTNLTLLLGLPALIWSLAIGPTPSTGGRRKPATTRHRLNTLSLALTLTALFFFTGALWALGRDGELGFDDGLVLVGLFLFWQVLQGFDAIKYNIQRKRNVGWGVWVDSVLVVAFGIGVFKGIDQLVQWVMALGPGVFLYDRLGLISGCLMVLPNALLAAYYAWAGRADIVYSSQVGDAHICIPMCIGLFALFSPMRVPIHMDRGLGILLGAGILHLLFVCMLGRLPRAMGAVLTGVYVLFIYSGIMAP